MNRIVVIMPYIGRILSKNYYKFPHGGTKPPAKMWARDLADKIRQLTIIPPTASSFQVGIRGHFCSENRPDIQNLFDLVSDAVQDGLGVNDKHFTMADDGYETGYLKPELVITIEEIVKFEQPNEGVLQRSGRILGPKTHLPKDWHTRVFIKEAK